MGPRFQELLLHRTAPLRDDGSAGLQRRRLFGEKAPAFLDAVLLLCDFSDSLLVGRYGQVPGEFPPPMQTEIYYAAHDSVFFDHLLRDVADYYDDVSGGVFTLNFTIHPRVVNLPHPMGFYGDHPENGEQPIRLAADVVDSLDAEIDFSLYDTVILVHAGAGGETDILGDSPEQIYSTYLDPKDFQEAHEDSLLDFPFLPTGDHPEGEGISHVLVLPETEYQDRVQGFGGYFGSLGVYCFEVGLRLGMLSLSDFTPAGRPDSQGIGEFGLMGYGLFVGMGWIPPHPCAFNKYLMGWLAPRQVSAHAAGDLRLTPCERTGDPDAALRVDITGREYWLLAYRQQDPDGNRIFTHPGDLNGNHIPDFYDYDSEYGDGRPTGYFDPETDTRERLQGCEWDFFMSENSARGAYDKGAGSGVYIWHVDEGVVEESFGLADNLFNADPRRKSVDLEEADGIQDLDSKVPSPFMLGGDDDSFRGEDQDTFDAWTDPGTETAGGAYTGVRFSSFSNVVRDSAAFLSYINERVDPPDTIMGFDYADTMTFTLSNIEAGGGGPGLHARRELPAGIDLRGSHLLLADLDGDGNEEIVAAGHAGEILVLDGQLNEFLDHDGQPETMEPFAVGTSGGEPVPWNLPAAVGNIDDDPEPEIILTGPDGIYAFNSDGTPVRSPDPGSHGLYLDLQQCDLPPVLVPVRPDSMFSPGEPALICVVETAAGHARLRLVRGGNADQSLEFDLGQVVVPSGPLFGWGRLLVATADTLSGSPRLYFVDPDPGADPGDSPALYLDLTSQPGPHPLQLGLVQPARPEQSARYAIVRGAAGGTETLVFAADWAPVLENIVWDGHLVPGTGPVPGGALVADGLLGRAGHNGEWLDGWPVRPRNTVEIPLAGCDSAPLVCNLDDNETTLDHYLFPVRDGRIFGRGSQGETIDGWPLAGPGQSAGTPALGRVLGGDRLDLVAVGTFDRITGLDAEGVELTSTTVSSLAIWSDVAVGAVWPMWGGSPWHNGFWAMAGWNSPPSSADGDGIVSGSHSCYPNPLMTGPLFVRGSTRSEGRARATIYNLSGEVVTTSPWRPVSAREPFAIAVDLDGAVSGLYLCRLTVEASSGNVDHSVISFAVVR